MNRRKLSIVFLSLILVLALVLSACNGDNDSQPTGANGATRYEYKGELAENGWAVEAWLDVKDGAVVDAFFDYVDEEGGLKSEDQEYIDTMRDLSEVGADISVIINYLENYLENNTDVDSVDADAVSGATSTYNNFLTAAEDLYKQAGLTE